MSITCYTKIDIKRKGLYRSKKVDTYWYYLRFVNDTMVISVSSSGEPEEIKSWFNENHEGVSVGTYQIKNNSISFSTKSKNGEVSYTGILKNNNKLLLRAKSHINGNISHRVYKYEQY